MNWLCVVFVGVAVLGGINWHFNSKYHFVGPKRAEDCFELNPLRTMSESDNLNNAEDGSSAASDHLPTSEHIAHSQVVIT